MSFKTRENSIADGQPVRLYLFERGATWRYAYTSANRDIDYMGIRYTCHPIDDDGIRMTGEASADTLKIKAQADIPPAQLFRGAPPSDEISLTVWDYHYGEPDASASAEVAWMGSISTVRWPDVDRCEISCESLDASLNQAGLSGIWGKECDNTIYDSGCRVDRTLHQVSAVIITMDGATITYSAALTGVFGGGMVEWTIPGGHIERRTIASESGWVLSLLGGTYGLSLGQTITLYKGCDGTMNCCSSRFGNHPNYGGYLHIPGDSPFDGNAIF